MNTDRKTNSTNSRKAPKRQARCGATSENCALPVATERIGAVIMEMLARFLPHAGALFEDSRKVGPQQINSFAAANFAMLMAYVAAAPEYRAAMPDCSRMALRRMAASALSSLAEQSSLGVEAFTWTYAGYAMLLLPRRTLPEDVRRRLEDGVIAGADRLLDYRFPSGLYYDTKAEETCWTAGPLVLAEALAPRHPHVERWREKALCFFLNAYNREEDNWCDETVDGKPVRARVCTANVFPDYTTENHCAFHPNYQLCMDNYGIPYLVYKRHLGHVPRAIAWNWAGLHEVVCRITMADGRLLGPCGQDYPLDNHAGHPHYWALMADALKNPFALWALKKNLNRVIERQTLPAVNGRFYAPGLELAAGQEFWEIHAATFLCVAHALTPFRGIPELSDAAALAVGAGPWHSPYTQMALAKGKRLHTAMGLRALGGVPRPIGFVIPQDAGWWTDTFARSPSLGAEILGPDKTPHYLHKRDQVLGHSSDEAWLLGQYSDIETSVLHTVGFVAHEEGVLHLERVMRYGEHREAGSSPWHVATLNYRITQEPVRPQPIRVRTLEGEIVLGAEEREWRSSGNWVLLNNTLGLIRFWGDAEWVFTWSRESEQSPVFPHNAMALRCALILRGEQPRGYGLMGGHAVLIAPASDPAALEAIIAEKRCAVKEKHGKFEVKMAVGSWQARYLLDLGHVIAFDVKPRNRHQTPD